MKLWLMQFSLINSRCNITFLVFWISQGSVATLITWGGWSLYHYMCRSFLNLMVKTALKSVNLWRSYRQKYVCSFYAQSVSNAKNAFKRECRESRTRLESVEFHVADAPIFGCRVRLDWLVNCTEQVAEFVDCLFVDCFCLCYTVWLCSVDIGSFVNGH